MKGSLTISKNMTNENIKRISTKNTLKIIRASNNNIDIDNEEEEEINENANYLMNNTKFNKRYIEGKPEKISSKDESDSSLIKKK